MSRRNFISPITNASQPVNSQHIHNLISNTNEKDMLFYEYEIVDKDKEAKWARREARRYGLCLCSRWLFMIIGNAILIALTSSTCAILIFVNTPIGITVKPLTLGQSCVTGSNNCDWLRYLVCSNEVCGCYSNRAWNGTDCTCTSDEYWDGLSCIKNPGYQQPCSTINSCNNKFTCDPLTSTCLCPSASTTVYTQYYTGLVTNLYSGTCQPKGSYGSGCTNYGVASCQEYNGLTCSLGAGAIFTCQCYTGYYWRSDLGRCYLQGQKPFESCTGSTVSNFGCLLNSSLTCDTSTYLCKCATTYYWNNNTNTCNVYGGYQSLCYDDSWCNSVMGLKCYFTPMTKCDCPIATTNAKCDCLSTHYWDGQKCTIRTGNGTPCPGNYGCTGALLCLYGYCL